MSSPVSLVYAIKNSSDANRILDRLKRLDQTVPQIKGGKPVISKKVQLPTARR